MDQFNFNNFPETNFNEVNLRWMLEVMTQFKEDIESGQFVGPQGPQGDPGPAGDGITEEVKQALLQLARKVAYIDDQGQTYYQDLYDALYGTTPAELVSISAVYTQTGAVYDTDSLDSLKPDLVVTATYSDSSTAVIPAADYTLSGSLTVGTSTITVSYQGKTATFQVTVTAGGAELISISAVYTQTGAVYDTDSLDSLKPDLVVTATYSDSSTATVSNYTLSGTLTVGTSTVTVSYGGQTTTFTVTVTEKQGNLIFTEPLMMRSTNNQFSWNNETQTGSAVGYGALSWGSLVAQNLLYKFSDVSDKRIRISYTLTLSDLVEGHTGNGSFMDIGLYTSATPENAGSARKATYETTKYTENGTYTVDETYDLSTIFTGSGLGSYYLGIAWFMHLTGSNTVHGTISNIRAEVI